MIISNWGNYPKIDASVYSGSFAEEFQITLSKSGKFICRGNGRSYGDASLHTDIIAMTSYSRFIDFDSEKGILNCQSGVLLSEILEVIIPKGFFLPVTPGTKFITLGGAVAANVHGKNHHSEGSFSSHVLGLKLMGGDGSVVHCSPNENSSLFWETFGAMGLTGIILEVSIQLKKIQTSQIKVESLKAKNFIQAMELFEESQTWTYSVAWIDCLSKGKQLGRSILMRGEHAKLDEIPSEKGTLKTTQKRNLNVPFNFPGFTLNKYTIKGFNAVYYGRQRKKESSFFQAYNDFFYPLDFIYNWNRMYGSRGFTQYQCAIPLEYSESGLKEILELLSRKGKGSFLAVLKRFGKKDPLAVNSFPMEGYTLALDFKIDNETVALTKQLDEIVKKYHGRLYLAKDSFCSDYSLVNYTRTSSKYFDEKFSSMQSIRIQKLNK